MTDGVYTIIELWSTHLGAGERPRTSAELAPAAPGEGEAPPSLASAPQGQGSPAHSPRAFPAFLVPAWREARRCHRASPRSAPYAAECGIHRERRQMKRQIERWNGSATLRAMPAGHGVSFVTVQPAPTQSPSAMQAVLVPAAAGAPLASWKPAVQAEQSSAPSRHRR